jgi:flagellar hook-length control protein FliK
MRGDRKPLLADADALSPAASFPADGPKTQAKSEDTVPLKEQKQNGNQDQSQASIIVTAAPASQPGAGAASAAMTPPAGANSPAQAGAGTPGPPVPLPTEAARAPQDENTAPSPIVVQSARVLERMGQTEMRVGVNTASFGNVELHATVNQDQVGASVATSHLELHAALLAEMPSLQRAMEQHHLRLDSLELNARAGSQDSGGSAGHQPRSQPGAQSGFRFSQVGEPVGAPDSPSPPGWIAPHSAGLNVHA